MTTAETMEKTVCLQCGGAMVQSGGGAGRPRSYCSVACRRAAEYSIKRLHGRLVGLEDRLEELNDPKSSAHLIYSDAAAEKERLRARIDVHDRNLRRLLSGMPWENDTITLRKVL